ncbi:MAG: V4R domain-containing protein [Nitrososphaerota archaeon]|nr:V4R domain-containing protein [Nitrososphaerota archaeon]
MSGEALKLNPKEVLCYEYLPNAKVIEWSLKSKNIPKILNIALNILADKGVRFLSGFQSINRDDNTVIIGGFIDISDSKIKAEDIKNILKNVEGVIEVNISDQTFDGLIIDTLHFPLQVSGERSFTFRVETFGGILKRLYDKFGTGAAVILYEMGVAAGESKARSIMKKYRLDKSKILKLIMAERAAKGWCISEVVEFSSRNVILVVRDLFECLPFKGKQENAVSQFFRGYLTGLLRQIFNKDVTVTEVECVAKGDASCKFNVEVKV